MRCGVSGERELLDRWQWQRDGGCGGLMVFERAKIAVLDGS